VVQLIVYLFAVDACFCTAACPALLHYVKMGSVASAIVTTVWIVTLQYARRKPAPKIL